MKVLIVGCGWVGTYLASQMRNQGAKIWATCTTSDKAPILARMGMQVSVVDFDNGGVVGGLDEIVFDLVIVSVPVKRKDAFETAATRFARLVSFLGELSFKQSLFFSSVGIYPNVNAVITEDTFTAHELDQKLWMGESNLRSAFVDVNILRLGGLFGLDRVFAKYFVGKVCEIGSQTANFVHVEDIYRIVLAMVERHVQGMTYNAVCPHHPLKKEVIMASAFKYGYGLPSLFTDSDRTAKVVSPDRLIADLDYSFVYPSPLQF